jgi:hypothetical protein
VERDKDKQLYDMVQKYSSGEISRELLGLNTKQERNYVDFGKRHLSELTRQKSGKKTPT